MESASSADSNPLVAGSELGNYRIKKLLGKGGMGEVYLAEDLRLKRDVALKVLPPQLNQDKTYLSRFRREAQSAASLHHSNICVIHEIGEVDGRSYIAMEYIEGVSLRQYLEEQALKVEEALKIAIQIAEALEEARKKNIIHRDIKPANIMITSSKQVKLLDFGLSKQLHDAAQELSNAATESRITEDGVTVGTVAYMSPEQALGKTIDLRSDIFSFGIVLYEMLTGRLPFAGNSSAQLLNAIVNQEPPSIARYNDNVSDALLRVVNKMLRKDPEDRYQSVHEVWSDLRQIQHETTEVAKRSHPGEFKHQRKYLNWVISLAIILVAITATWLLRSKSSNTVANISSLVALPCKVYGSPEMNYLADAVPSTLSTHLSAIKGLETKVPPSSVELEKLHGDLTRISKAYQVNSLILSSLMVEANRFVLDVQLVDAESKRVLWSKEYEGTRDTYIDLTRQAANGIRETIQPTSAAIQTVPTLPSNSEAELAFREGLFYSKRFNDRREHADFEQSFHAFNRALQLDPKLANAAAGIAALYDFRLESGEPKETFLPEMKKWAERALQIDPKCARGWAQLSLVELIQGRNFRNQLQYSLTAASLGKRDSGPQLSLGIALSNFSETLAMQACIRSNELDPLYLYPPLNVAVILISLGRAKEAFPWLDKAFSIESDSPFGLWIKIWALVEAERLTEAIPLRNRFQVLVSQGKISESYLTAIDILINLESNKQKQALVSLRNLQTSDALMDSNCLAMVGPALARHNFKEELFQMLELAVKGKSLPYDFVILNPEFKRVSDDPRFQKILADTRIQFDEMIVILQEARARDQFPEYLKQPMDDMLKKVL